MMAYTVLQFSEKSGKIGVCPIYFKWHFKEIGTTTFLLEAKI